MKIKKNLYPDSIVAVLSQHRFFISGNEPRETGDEREKESERESKRVSKWVERTVNGRTKIVWVWRKEGDIKMHELVKIRTLSVAFACIVTQRATTSGFLPFLNSHLLTQTKYISQPPPQNTQTPTNKHEKKENKKTVTYKRIERRKNPVELNKVFQHYFPTFFFSFFLPYFFIIFFSPLFFSMNFFIWIFFFRKNVKKKITWIYWCCLV